MGGPPSKRTAPPSAAPPGAEPDTDPQAPTALQAAPPAERRPLRWRGLLVVLGGYGVLVLLYVWFQYVRTPEYQAAAAYEEAHELLGPQEGVTAGIPELIAGYERLLEAARLVPRERELHEQLERIRYRIEERGGSVPPRLRMQAEAAAGLMQRLEQEDAPYLAVGRRERGWAPDQLARGPGRAFGWAVLGGLLLVALWAYLRFGARRAHADDREEYLKEVERELEEREAKRRLNQRRR